MRKIEYRIQELENGYMLQYIPIGADDHRRVYAPTATDIGAALTEEILQAEQARETEETRIADSRSTEG